MVFRYRLCGLVLFGTVVLSARAEVVETEAQGEALYLDELVITGTRNERRLLDTPVRTQVVTSEELEKTHARSLEEALMNVPGVQIREIHGKSGYEVRLQGLDSNQVLVLVDGLPMTATTGSAVDVSQLAMLDIERVEVIKGAVSSQYGSAGMGGVVNIITRGVQPGVRGQITLDGGSYGDQNPSDDNPDLARYNGSAVVSAGNETWGVRVSGSARHSDGVDPEPETWSRPGNEYDRNDIAARVDWRPSAEDALSLSLSRFTEDSDARYVEPASGQEYPQGKDEAVERIRTTVSGRHGIAGPVQGQWALVHETLSDDTCKYTVDSRFDRRDADMSLSGASGHLDWLLATAHQLQVGVDARRETLEQYNDGNSELDLDGEASRESYELWLQDTWLPTERLEIVTGIRGQRDSDFGSHAAPGIRARLDLGDGEGLETFVRGGIGSGYRVPNLKERHYRFDHSQLGYVVKGSSGLEPETSVSYQLGLGMHLDRKLWFEVNGFFNDIEDLIQTGIDQAATDDRNDGVTVYRYQNLDEARTWGLESTAGWQLAPGWSLSAGYTLTRTEDRGTGNELNNRPRHQSRLSLDGRTGIPGMTWLLRVRNQSSEYADASLDKKSPGYTAVDLKFNYSMSPGLSVFAGADNLTNSQRDFDNAESDFRPVAGRFLYAGLTLTLGEH